MKVITICGSLKLKKEMIILEKKLALAGYCVLQPVLIDDNLILTEEQLKKLKAAHLKRIELSDSIYVINKDNYIGESTRLEIEYAKKLGKEIIYYNF